jgi:hypothetical protein
VFKSENVSQNPRLVSFSPIGKQLFIIGVALQPIGAHIHRCFLAATADGFNKIIFGITSAGKTLLRGLLFYTGLL